MANRLALITLTCAAFSPPSGAQASPASASAGWQISATVAEESVGQGLPVLALDRPDWPDHMSDQLANARAFRSMKIELSATHPTGWRMATLTRAEAWLHANANAVTLATLQAQRSDPATVRNFSLYARTQSWQGDGILVGTPWWKLDTSGAWQWQAEVTLLQLRQLNVAKLSGELHYRGGGLYDFDLHSRRSDTSITSPFLPASGASGLGASLSVALIGQPAPGWRVQLRANDLASQLQWSDLATDTSALNTNVTSRAPDGSLDYAPLIKGQKALVEVTSRMGVNWQAQVAWSAFENQRQSGAVTLRANRKTEINQFWLGWDSGDLTPKTPRWHIEFEPSWQALKLEMSWGGWQILIATDGKDLNSQYRQLRLGWQTYF